MVMAALALTAMMGMSGMAVEVGTGYTTKVRNQRVADMAALGAALAYKNGGQSAAVATQVAKDIVVANGLSASQATVTVPVTIDGADAVQVQITTAVPVKMASLISGNASYDVTNLAAASLTSAASSGCVTVLSNTTTAVSADGGASVSASGCSIVTNGTIYSSNSSAKVTAKSIIAQAINDVSKSGVTTTPTAKNWTLKSNGASDFIQSNTSASTALCYVNKLTNSTDSDYSDGNINCTNQRVPTTAITSNGSTQDWTTGYTVKGGAGIAQYETADYSCKYIIPASANVVVRDLTIGGGCSVTFQGGGSFRNVSMSGDSLSFGDGTVTMSGTFTVNANQTVTIGDGAHSFGALAIGGGKSLSVGSGNFYVTNAISLSGGAFIKVDISTGDKVTIGNDGSGNAITVQGGSKACFTSDCSMATAAAGTFSADGSVNVLGGGSTVVFPKSVVHVINGDLIATATVLFGPGLYVIKGNFQNTVGSGSDSMNGTDITFAMGGTINFAGGSKFDMAAPSSSGTYGIQDMLILTKSTSNSVLSAGSVGKASGMIYAPKSAFSSSGGSAISGNGSACMMLMVKTLTVTGSGTVNTAGCDSLTASSGGTVALLK